MSTRNYDNGCCISHRVRQHARRTMLRPVRVDRGNNPPQFARANQNIATAAMLLRGLSKPNDPHEQAIQKNIRALVETAAVQQAECSISRHRLMALLPVR